MAVSVVRNLCQMGLVGNGCRRDIAVAERMRARGPVGRQVAVVYGWLSGYLCKLGWYVPAPDFAIVLFWFGTPVESCLFSVFCSVDLEVTLDLRSSEEFECFVVARGGFLGARVLPSIDL